MSHIIIGDGVETVAAVRLTSSSAIAERPCCRVH